MADRAISELVAAEKITATDMFVLEQNGTAKKLTGQILLNWLTAAADGHGGIASIAKVSTSGLADTYRITLADTTPFDFVVNNGKGIKSIAKKSTSGLVDTYAITYTDGTSGSFTVTNGAKGDQGDAAYIWVKYASQEPTSASVSLSDVPDAWMGIYVGTSATAPTSYSSYKWYQIKGDKGDPGDPATLISSTVTYQVGDSGVVIPSGTWYAAVPAVPQGKFLWTKIVQNFNTGSPVVYYSVGRMGVDGLGSVVSVCGVSPGSEGNVPLTAANVGALPLAGGSMAGPINMNGQALSGLNAPTAADQAATKGYVDNNMVAKSAVSNSLEVAAAGYVADARAVAALNTKINAGMFVRGIPNTWGSTNKTMQIKFTPISGKLVGFVFYTNSSSTNEMTLIASKDGGIIENVTLTNITGEHTLVANSDGSTLTITGFGSYGSAVIILNTPFEVSMIA